MLPCVQTLPLRVCLGRQSTGRVDLEPVCISYYAYSSQVCTAMYLYTAHTLIDPRVSPQVHGISIGDNHAALVTSHGAVYTWGSACWRQLGNAHNPSNAPGSSAESSLSFCTILTYYSVRARQPDQFDRTQATSSRVCWARTGNKRATAKRQQHTGVRLLAGPMQTSNLQSP